MSKVDKVIEIIREMMVGNAPAAGGAFGANSPASGPTAGQDMPVGKLDGRTKIMRRLPPAYRKLFNKKNK